MCQVLLNMHRSGKTPYESKQKCITRPADTAMTRFNTGISYRDIYIRTTAIVPPGITRQWRIVNRYPGATNISLYPNINIQQAIFAKSIFPHFKMSIAVGSYNGFLITGVNPG